MKVRFYIPCLNDAKYFYKERNLTCVTHDLFSNIANLAAALMQKSKTYDTFSLLKKFMFFMIS